MNSRMKEGSVGGRVKVKDYAAKDIVEVECFVEVGWQLMVTWRLRFKGTSSAFMVGRSTTENITKLS